MPSISDSYSPPPLLIVRNLRGGISISLGSDYVRLYKNILRLITVHSHLIWCLGAAKSQCSPWLAIGFKFDVHNNWQAKRMSYSPLKVYFLAHVPIHLFIGGPWLSGRVLASGPVGPRDRYSAGALMMW